MKKLLFILALLSGNVFSQTFPVNNLQVNGTATFNGAANFTNTASTALTPTVGDNTTKLATTAYVANNRVCPSIMDFGGNNTGTANNDTALTNAVAASPSGFACVSFPTGTFNFNANWAYTFPNGTSSITFLGSGADNTKFVWAGGGGMTFNFVNSNNSVHIRDVSYLTGLSNNTGVAINLIQTLGAITLYNAALSDITNVTIRGSDGYNIGHFWNTGVIATGVGNIDFTNLNVNGSLNFNTGTGVSVSGTASNVGIVYNFQGCLFAGLNNGILYGTEVQGMTVNQSNFTNLQVGIGVTGGVVNPGQLSVTGSQFAALSAGILVSSAINGISISNNFFLVATNAVGISLNPSSTTTIVGNVIQNNFSATSTNGIAFVSYHDGSSVVTGNQFAGLTNGINLTSGAHNVNVQSNAYSANTSNVVNNCAGGCTVGGGSQ